MKKYIFLGIVIALINGVFIGKDYMENRKNKEIQVKDKIEKKVKTEEKKEVNKVLKREDIKKEYKWNLADIYENWDKWNEDVKVMESLMDKIATYKGQIRNNPQNFIKMMELEEKLSRLSEKVYLYPYLMKDLNSKNEEASIKIQEIESIYTKYSISTAWITPEILEIPETTMNQWLEEYPELDSYKFQIKEIYRLQKHILSEDKERLLSYFGQYMGAPSDIYGELSTSDIKWNDVTFSTGETLPVTNGVYGKVVSTYKNQEDRKKAFEALYKSYLVNKNTYGAIYRNLLQRDFASAQSRNYKSALEKSLEPKNIPEKVYTTLIESTRENTAPLKRYIALRKKALKLENYYYYDNQINIVDYNREFTYEEAKKDVIDSVIPLGKEYQESLKKALSAGWLDVFETENKRSGAYSISIYDVHPYMLLNYNGTLDSVFTLAHELGHTMHSMLSVENQPYSTSQYTIFVAEVASTFNERLLLDSMLKKTKDPKERIALIEQALGNIVGTYYIQTMFADYEYQAHKIVENGGAITPEVLDNIMGTLFKEYFGEEIKVDDLQKLIWARIPHFYNSPYYVYQYATSFASSAALYDKVTDNKYSKEEREEALNRYLTLLKSGGNDYPMEQLKKAGVDLTKKESFQFIGDEFNRLLDLLEAELNKNN
ncbi:oligoendopeptidase F [Cetobacterium ceti]|uniref:Oligopeptidase F n=1 Tax=Cetobacterium ceti TaxID=180163 RepID=A0A1T4JUJ4_9FUSO|nr:oligoendopeptidase F [Cetobacterium ceti]